MPAGPATDAFVCRNYGKYWCNHSIVGGHQPSHLHERRQVLSGRRVFFIGDSLSLQHMNAMACDLRADERATFPNTTVVRAGFARFGFARVIDVNSSSPAFCVTPRVGEEGGGVELVCHLDAGKRMTPSVVHACRAVLPILRPRDVIVANQGVWQRRDSDDGEEELATIRELIESGVVEQLAARRVFFAWRETLAQHFSVSPSGLYKTECTKRVCGTCSSIQNTTIPVKRNAHATALLRNGSVRVLPLFSRSLPYLDGQHVGRRLGRTCDLQTPPKCTHTLQTLDCTHWCETPPAAGAAIFREASRMVLDMLEKDSY